MLHYLYGSSCGGNCDVVFCLRRFIQLTSSPCSVFILTVFLYYSECFKIFKYFWYKADPDHVIIINCRVAFISITLTLKKIPLKKPATATAPDVKKDSQSQRVKCSYQRSTSIIRSLKFKRFFYVSFTKINIQAQNVSKNCETVL